VFDGSVGSHYVFYHEIHMAICGALDHKLWHYLVNMAQY
jgi:hypothetical protein